MEVKEGSTTLVKFGYDGLNRRITKLVGSDTYHYYLSEQNQVLEEQKQVGSGTPTLHNDYIWHPHYVDALAIRYDVSGVSPVAYYALHDANFNITAMVDGNGAVVERYQYTPYGQVICTDPSFANPTATSTIGQRNLYTGRELDLETGLYYYRARYYHNALGRFIGRDSIEYGSGDANLYRYVRNKTTIGLDPSGTTDLSIIIIPALDLDPVTGNPDGYEAQQTGHAPGWENQGLGTVITVDDIADANGQLSGMTSNGDCVKELNIVGHAGKKPGQVLVGSVNYPHRPGVAVGVQPEITWMPIAWPLYVPVQVYRPYGIDKLFKNVRFCQPCVIKVRGCESIAGAEGAALAGFITAATGCSVQGHAGKPTPHPTNITTPQTTSGHDFPGGLDRPGRPRPTNPPLGR